MIQERQSRFDQPRDNQGNNQRRRQAQSVQAPRSESLTRPKKLLIGLQSIQAKQEWQKILSESGDDAPGDFQPDNPGSIILNQTINDGSEEYDQASLMNTDIDHSDFAVTLQPSLNARPNHGRHPPRGNTQNDTDNRQNNEIQVSPLESQDEYNGGQSGTSSSQDHVAARTEVQAMGNIRQNQTMQSRLSINVDACDIVQVDDANENIETDRVTSTASLIEMVHNSGRFNINGKRYRFEANSQEVESLLSRHSDTRSELSIQQIGQTSILQQTPQPSRRPANMFAMTPLNNYSRESSASGFSTTSNHVARQGSYPYLLAGTGEQKVTFNQSPPRRQETRQDRRRRLNVQVAAQPDLHIEPTQQSQNQQQEQNAIDVNQQQNIGQEIIPLQENLNQEPSQLSQNAVSSLIEQAQANTISPPPVSPNPAGGRRRRKNVKIAVSSEFEDKQNTGTPNVHSNAVTQQKSSEAQQAQVQSSLGAGISFENLLNGLTDLETELCVKTKGGKPKNLKKYTSKIASEQDMRKGEMRQLLIKHGLNVDQSPDLLNKLTEMCQTATKAKKRNRDGESVDIVFLHASPLVFNDYDMSSNGMSKGYTAVPQLNFRQEAEQIKKAIKSSGLEVIYESKIATRENFERTIRKKPKIIHISCHGLKLENETERVNKFSLDSADDAGLQDHYLMFEDLKGSSELVCALELRKLLLSAQHDIDLIVVAACDSERIGRIFQKCGVKHVVCVEQSRKVLDQAAIKFTETFYALLFEQQTKICEAFDTAVKSVGFTKGENEANLFMCLVPEEPEEIVDTKWKENNHKCFRLPAIPPGLWKCASDHNRVKQIPARLESLKFREKDMAILFDHMINQNDKIISVIGLRGIGKSSLARNTLHYAAERKTFSHGIMLIQLKDTRTCLAMSKLIMHAILKFLDFSEGGSEAKDKFLEQNFSLYDMTNYFISFFNNKQEEQLKKKKKHGARDLFLLCLDNAENIIENDKENFLDFLEILHEECDQLRIIVTSDFSMGQLPKGTNPVAFMLNPLRPLFSAELFLENSGELDHQEVVDFVLKDTKFPFEKVFAKIAEKGQSADNHDPEVGREGQLKNLIRNRETLIQVLSEHDMFRQIQGNPTSITLMAAICANGMIVRKNENPLIDIYNKIIEEKDIVVQQIGQDEAGLTKHHYRTYKNTMSLKITAETSIALLKNSESKDALDLLSLLSCLPGGVKEEQLKQLMHKDCSEDLERLKNFNFLELGMDKQMLTPFVLHYCQEGLIDDNQKTVCLQKICNYYKGILAAIFKLINRKQAPFLTKETQDSKKSRKSMRQSFQSQKSSTSISENKSMSSLNLVPNQGMIKHIYEQAKQLPDQDVETKTLFDQLQSELRNLDFCLNFMIDYGMENKQKQSTKIRSNNVSRRNLIMESKQVGTDIQENKSSMGSSSDFDSDTSSDDLSAEIDSFQDSREMENKSSGVEAVPGFMQQMNSQVNLIGHIRRKSLVGSQINLGSNRRNTMPANFAKQSLSLNLRRNTILNKVQEGEESYSDSDFSRESAKQFQSPDLSRISDATFDQVTQKVNRLLSPLNKKERVKQLQFQNQQNYRDRMYTCVVSTPTSKGTLDKSMDLSFDLMAKNLQNHKRIKLNIGERRLSNESADDNGYTRSDEANSADREKPQENLNHRGINLPDNRIPQNEEEIKPSNTMLSSDFFAEMMNQFSVDEPKDSVAPQLAKKSSRYRNEEDYQQAQGFQTDLEQKMFANRRVAIGRKKVAFTNQASQVKTRDDQSIYRRQSTNWNEMTDVGEFIMLAVANAFLTNDLEYSLSISTSDFSYLANSSLFEGNILRFQSLASIKLFERAIEHENSYENFGFLAQAIDSAQNALTIYNPDDSMSSAQKNFHGTALTNYLLGYIYLTFDFVVCADQIRQNKDFEKYALEEEEHAHDKASQYFEEAFECFKELNHLVGKYLSKKRQLETHSIFSSSDSCGADQLANNEAKIVEKELKNLQKYHKEVGIDESCFIYRQQGEDYSLMTEFVNETNGESLFPQKIIKNKKSNESLDQDQKEEQKDDQLLPLSNQLKKKSSAARRQGFKQLAQKSAII